jgi:hypothetical protein
VPELKADGIHFVAQLLMVELNVNGLSDRSRTKSEEAEMKDQRLLTPRLRRRRDKALQLR